MDSAEDAARIVRAARALGPGGVVIALPVPIEHAVEPVELERWIESALADAAAEGIKGKAVTPFLLARIAEASGGRDLAANRALLNANAALAAEIAVALAAISG